jgi:maltose O-acetyltransferase
MHWWTWLLAAAGFVLLVMVIAVARYHRKHQVKQPLGVVLFRYFIGDYLMFPLKWCPGVLGIGARYLLYRLVFKRIGKSVTILEGVHLINPEEISVGDHSGIGYQCFFEATGPIRIGSWVRIGPYVSFFTTNHRFGSRDTLIKHQGYDVGTIDVGDDVWFGANVTVLPNVKIGRGAVIGAGAVVNKDIPEYGIAVGNPAKVVRYRESASDPQAEQATGHGRDQDRERDERDAGADRRADRAE